MYLSHIFTRYFGGNKNDSPASEQICAPFGLLKYSLITIFYPEVTEECVPKWIRFPLLLSRSLFFVFPLFFFLPFSPLYCFHSPSFSWSPCLPFNDLHMSTKWPWHCSDKVKCPGAPSPCWDHSVLLTVHNPNPLPTHLSKPHYQDPIHLLLCRPFVTPSCYQSEKKKRGTLCVSDAHFFFTWRGRCCSSDSDLKIEPGTKAIIASSKNVSLVWRGL